MTLERDEIAGLLEMKQTGLIQRVIEAVGMDDGAFTPRSKYYAIKTIWFREEIVKRGIKLLKIDTVEQLGDLFTKGLTKQTFEYLRKKIMGW